MKINYIENGDILKSLDHLILNPVNTKGVMGAGLAKQYKVKYPNMFNDYKLKCDNDELRIGSIHSFNISNLNNNDEFQYIINIPTKKDWKDMSQLEYVEQGLAALNQYILSDINIKNIKDSLTISIPKLGCGLGGLNWFEVHLMIINKFKEISNIDITLNIYGEKPKVVAFTGRRPKDIYGYDEDQRKNYSNIIKSLIVELENYINDDYTHFISGGAQGFDQLAFWAVHSLKSKYPDKEINNIIAIPCDYQSSKWSATGLFSKQEYNKMLKNADIVINIDKDNGASIFELMHNRNHYMVDHANILIGYYPNNNWETVNKSGTAKTMQYAKKNNCKVHQIWYS